MAVSAIDRRRFHDMSPLVEKGAGPFFVRARIPVTFRSRPGSVCCQSWMHHTAGVWLHEAEVALHGSIGEIAVVSPHSPLNITAVP